MVKVKKNALTVQTDGKRHFINVPAAKSMDLHNYLRLKRILSSPPEPSLKGMDCIQLSNTIDVDSVQTHLNAWQ